MSSINSFKQMDPDLGLARQLDQFSLRQPQIGEGGKVGEAQSGNGPAGVGSSFFEALQKSMEEVNENQLQADSSIKDLMAGKSKNIHETMLAIQKADLSLKTMMQVRNKILEAYKEVMRMQV
jgi:flagellar hook-basal body complex protein FliE